MMRRASHTLAVAIVALAAAVALLGAAGSIAPPPLAWAGIFLTEWLLMTGAMMLPSSVPFLAAVHRVGGGAAGCVAAAAYVTAWGLLGCVLCGALWLAGDVLARYPPDTVARAAGASLIAAAAYQLTPLARSCQRACAHPFAILARHWHGPGGRGWGAWNAGLHYGLSCIGCCVAMIVVMLVLGVHDLVWMLLFAGLMVLQKHAAWGGRYAMAAAAATSIAGLALFAGWWAPSLKGLRALCGG